MKDSGILHYDVVSVVPDVSKERVAFILKGSRSRDRMLLDLETFKMKVMCSFETSGNKEPATRRHTPEDLNPRALIYMYLCIRTCV